MELKTPLYPKHVAHDGRIVPFAGYLLPVQYPSGIITEHTAVRTQAGLFDVSHMGEFILSGKDALKNINHLLTNNFDGMYDGQIRYSPMCNPKGGVIDDLLVYRKNEEEYLLVVNAANKAKDASWIKDNISGDVVFTDSSDTIAQIALQGPKAKEILEKLTEEAYIPKKYYSFVEEGIVAGVKAIVSKTGYTGENGFELYCKNEDACTLWDALLTAGKEFGLIPCGLGARDTLRLEAGMPLYGHEMTEEITPLEAGLSMFVKMDKADFIGKSALEQQPPQRKRIGLKMVGRGIAREGATVLLGDKEIGFVTSGTHAPTLGYAIAAALVDADKAQLGETVEIDVRGRKIAAEVIALPFYKKA